MVDLFDKFDPLLATKAELPKDTTDPFAVCMEKILSQTEAIIDNRKTILAGTNNYLGLTHNPKAIEAAHRALDETGTGTTGSRVLNGTFAGHRELEESLCRFFGTEHAMVFSTGYQANLGIISTIVGRDDFVLIDGDCHASIYDGCGLGQATVIRFRHNDPADLDKRLRRLEKHPDAGKLVIVEGIYSMLGDRAPVAEIADVCTRYGASLMVDEAHSLGVCGATGRGVAEEQGVEDKVDFIVGTFSKSVGTIGGFCVSNHPKFEVLRLVCRPYMFTASLPPSVVASAIESLKVIPQSNLRAALWDNAGRLAQRLSGAGFTLGSTDSPIVAVVLDDKITAARCWDRLLKAGLYVNLALPPATPQGMCLLRCSLCAVHTPEQVNKMAEIFITVGREMGLIDCPSPVGERAGAGPFSESLPIAATAKST